MFSHQSQKGQFIYENKHNGTLESDLSLRSDHSFCCACNISIDQNMVLMYSLMAHGLLFFLSSENCQNILF